MCQVETVDVEFSEGRQGVEDRRGSPVHSPEDEEQDPLPYFPPGSGGEGEITSSNVSQGLALEPPREVLEMSPLRVVTAPLLHWSVAVADQKLRGLHRDKRGHWLPLLLPTESQVPSLETVIYLGQALAPPRNFT